MPCEGSHVVKIKPYIKDRSLAQNNLFHKWVDVIAKHIGYEADEMKSILKHKHLGYKYTTIKKTGEVIQELHETSKLDVKAFTELLEAIERDAARWGIPLPHPQDYYLAMGVK